MSDVLLKGKVQHLCLILTETETLIHSETSTKPINASVVDWESIVHCFWCYLHLKPIYHFVDALQKVLPQFTWCAGPLISAQASAH